MCQKLIVGRSPFNVAMNKAAGSLARECFGIPRTAGVVGRRSIRSPKMMKRKAVISSIAIPDGAFHLKRFIRPRMVGALGHNNLRHLIIQMVTYAPHGSSGTEGMGGLPEDSIVPRRARS